MQFKGSKTEKNLLDAFSGESQARNKYTFYADRAREEGYEQIGAIFDETAANEKEHAEIWLKILFGGSLPDTAVNLLNAIEGENNEAAEMYIEYANQAENEGFTGVARLFREVAEIEGEHRDRFVRLLENVENESVFDKNESVVWRCRNCCHVHISQSAPDICPVCAFPRAFFEIKAENY